MDNKINVRERLEKLVQNTPQDREFKHVSKSVSMESFREGLDPRSADIDDLLRRLHGPISGIPVEAGSDADSDPKDFRDC